MDRSGFDRPFQNVKDRSSSLIFEAIDHRHIVDNADVIRLPSRGWIECRFIEHSAGPAVKYACLDDVRIEFEQVRIVVIKPFCLHANSPLPAEVERDAQK